MTRKLVLITDDEWDSSDLRQADGPGYTTKGAVCAMLKKVYRSASRGVGGPQRIPVSPYYTQEVLGEMR